MPYTIITQPNCPACQDAKKELTLLRKDLRRGGHYPV